MQHVATYIPTVEHITMRFIFPNLEAVTGLLSIPDGVRQRKLSPHAILPHGSQGSAPLPLGLRVVSSEPQLLHERLAAGGEAEAFQQAVEVREAALVKGYSCLGLQHTLQLPGAAAGGGGGGQGEGRKSVKEGSKTVHTAALQEDLAHASYLLCIEDHCSRCSVQRFSLITLLNRAEVCEEH